ncbi:MAG: chemotaxis protein CheW, partial [Caulobacter sp.]|nr:chemotaxis protein CheW [Vitreoscilla sp.]
MANKDALRELQTRLASRLQAAKTQPRARGWLAVECAGVGLLLPLAQAGEIFPLRALLKLPHAKPWMTGVAQLRGDLYTVIDLAAFLGLRAPKTGEAAALDGQLVMLAPSLQVNAALRVDRLSGLRGEEQLTREAESAESVGARGPLAAPRRGGGGGAAPRGNGLGAGGA